MTDFCPHCSADLTKEDMLELADRLDFLVTASRPTIDGHIYLNGRAREALTDALTKLRSQGEKAPNDPRSPAVHSDVRQAVIEECVDAARAAYGEHMKNYVLTGSSSGIAGKMLDAVRALVSTTASSPATEDRT